LKIDAVVVASGGWSARHELTGAKSVHHACGRELCIRGIAEQEPMAIHTSDNVEIAPSDREPIPEARHAWGDDVTLSVADVRESSSYGFYLPRPPRASEQVGVYVEYPLFDNDGRRKDSVSWLTVYGTFIENEGTPMIVPPAMRV
jgi:hypothetical protein